MSKPSMILRVGFYWESSRNCLASVCCLALMLAMGMILGVERAAAQTTSTIEGTVTDKQGLRVAGATVLVEGDALATSRTVTTEANGSYSLPALPAGTYSISVSHPGFATRVSKGLALTLNRTVTLDIALDVGSNKEEVVVTSDLPLLETNASATSTTITPDQILNVPLNGRNYLDLLQLVPGVAINRQADLGSDNATNVLGERGNNTGFLIDGFPNQNELSGGAAAQFNQDTIAEFQVITSGYKAEFGHASGGVVNVITKSGGNDTHGLASVYHRNNVLDTSDIPNTDVPYLLRWDYDAAAGGAVIRDKFFWFASAEGIHENRQLNFVAPALTPQFLLDNEIRYDTPTTDRETRIFGKLDQTLGDHHLAEQINYTNAHLGNFNPLSLSTSLPSTRTNIGDRTMQLGFSDSATLGDRTNPFILSLRGQYRREKTMNSPAHADAGPNTIFNIFSGYDTGLVFGDVGTPNYGAVLTASTLDQQYTTFGTSISKTRGRHTVKLGWDFERTKVDGVEASGVQDQLFATQADYEEFGPIDSGFFLLLTIGGLTPEANDIKLRNNYNGLYLQDDWKVARNLTLNLGVRWDYDSEFKKTTDVSPRLGFAWSVTPKTVVRGSWGLFYDRFRLGIARDVPGFGGADLRQIQPLSYPRLFFGVPTIAPVLFGLCLSPTQTDAQLASGGATCPYDGVFVPPNTPIYGVDHLNNVVAPGHAAIPSNTAVNQSNIQQVSGLSPDAYLTAADAAIGAASDFFFWGPYGTLSYNVIQPSQYPVSIDPSFSTPYTRSLTFGVQRQLTNNWVIGADYYHKGIENILGTRQTNLAFESRIANNSIVPFENGYGPWYSGTYDAGIFSLDKRMSHHFTLGGSYAYVSEHDDALCSNLATSSVSAGSCFPTDSYRGTPPIVTDPGGAGCPSKTNADSSFIACNGNFVPKAGKYYDGATLDNGPSDFALRHTFELHGLVELPWKIQFSSLFRAQSGFRYTAQAKSPLDQDGNGNYGPRDQTTGRNSFTSPKFVNMDLRIMKSWVIRERFKVQAMFEFFNLFNNANPAAIQTQQSQQDTFGTVSQHLPGREGQVGLRLEF